LISLLFGFPTDIRGLDYLFGGGGILLSNSHDGAISTLPARTILIRGVCGSGKTILSLSLAAEVAARGGIAWYFAIDYTAAECLYILASLGIRNERDTFVVATTHVEVAAALDRVPPTQNKGLLAILALRTEDFEATWSQIDNHPVNLRWQAAMAPYFAPVEGVRPGERFAMLEEVFYLP